MSGGIIGLKREAQEIIIEPFRGLPPGAMCGTCAHAKLSPGPDGRLDITKRVCFRNPPLVVSMQMWKQVGINQYIPTVTQIVTSFPTVEAQGMRCHSWRPNPQGTPTDADTASQIMGEGKAN